MAVQPPEEILVEEGGILDEEIVIALPEEIKKEKIEEKVVFTEIEETEEEVEEEGEMKSSDFL